MCEILRKAVDATHPDPIIDLAGCYKAGDPVVICEDGFAWGAGELDTNVFTIEKFVGVPVADMQYLLDANQKSLANTAALKIPALARHQQKQLRDNINRKRYSINNGVITDKARV